MPHACHTRAAVLQEQTQGSWGLSGKGRSDPGPAPNADHGGCQELVPQGPSAEP